MSNEKINVNDMIKLRVPEEEQETTIQFDAESDLATMFTSDPTVVRDMKFRMKQNPDAFTCYEGTRDANNNLSSYWFKFPKELVAINSKKRTHNRAWTEEDRQKVSDRFKKEEN